MTHPLNFFKNGHYFRSKDNAILKILDFFKNRIFSTERQKKLKLMYMDALYNHDFFCKD